MRPTLGPTLRRWEHWEVGVMLSACMRTPHSAASNGGIDIAPHGGVVALSAGEPSNQRPLIIASCGPADAVERATDPLHRARIDAKALRYFAHALGAPWCLERSQDLRLQLWGYS